MSSLFYIEYKNRKMPMISPEWRLGRQYPECLHPADTARLLEILQRLVDAGNCVIIVRHKLEVGPEGGLAACQLPAEGTTKDVAQVKELYTGQCLKKEDLRGFKNLGGLSFSSHLFLFTPQLISPHSSHHQ
jgi:hypothetical protein